MTDESDIDGLAGEYVLGSLPPAEREAVAARLAHEPALAAAVAAWHRRLAPLDWQAQGIAPDPSLLAGILATVAPDGRHTPSTGDVVLLRRRLRTWQWIATGLAATVVGLAIGLGILTGDRVAPGRPTEVAVLASVPGSTTADEPAGDISVAFVASHDRYSGRLSIRQIAGRPAAGGRAFVAWMEPAAGRGEPTLLGILRGDGAPNHFDAGLFAQDFTTARLIVSLEQDRSGGMDRPRGPIVSAGGASRR